MKRWCLLALLIGWAVCAFAVERSKTIVYINGAKYYLHVVRTGETLYGLAQAYGLPEQQILANNPAAAQGLKKDLRLKIPVAEAPAGKPQSERKLRKTFDRHTVAQGETLYAISRRYEIPVNTLMADNPDVDPVHLRPGDTLLVRKKEIGTEDAEGTQLQWEAYRDQLNSLEGDSLAYHIVAKGETVYSLSRRFGLTEEQLCALNGGLKPAELKAGAMIRVRASGPAGGEEPEAPSEETEETADEQPVTVERKVPQIVLRALPASERLKVALLLPVEVNGAANANYLEFYQGFLLGLDSVKRRGRSVDVTLYNTARSAERVREIVGSPDFAGTRLIVGPVYEEALAPVIDYAEQHEIPVVSPLAQIRETKSDILFQMAPDPRFKYDKVTDLFDPGKRITLVYTGSTDKEFEQEMSLLLGSRPTHRFDFKYVHTKNNASNPTSDLTPVLDNDEDNVVIVMADNEIEVDRILAALASAHTNLTARGRREPRFAVLGNARWNRYNNIDRSIFFKDGVTFVSTYHAKRDASQVVEFDAAYIRAFGALPTLYAYRGYDAAMIFCPAMYDDIEYDMEGRRFAPLQTSYLFDQPDRNGHHVNKTWMRVNYRPDFTITLE